MDILEKLHRILAENTISLYFFFSGMCLASAKADDVLSEEARLCANWIA